MTTQKTANNNLTAVVLVMFMLWASLAIAQDDTPAAVTNQNRTGELPFSTSIGTGVESVDVSTGNLSIRIPITSVKGRGMDFNFGLRYDANYWNVATRGSGANTYQKWNIEKRNWLPDSTGLGWEPNQPRVTHARHRSSCGGSNFWVEHSDSYIYHDSDGGKHALELEWQNGHCEWPAGSGTDNGGYTVETLTGPDSSGAGIWATIVFQSNNPPSILLADGAADGIVGTQTSELIGPFAFDFQQLYGSFRDPNGNKKGEYAGGSDTLGRAIVTQQNGANQILYKVYDSNGTQQTYTVNFGTITLNTAFNLSGACCPWGPVLEMTGTRKVITSIVLPNGRSYSFQYENNSYGGLTRVDLPSGAYITYTWATFYAAENTHRYVTSRTVNVDGQSTTWNLSKACGAVCTQDGIMTVTDPLGNQAVYQSWEGNLKSVKLYQGAATGTLLRQYALEYFLLSAYKGNSTGGLPTRITTTLEDGLVSKKEFDYETFEYEWETCDEGQQCAIDEQMFGDGTQHGTGLTSRGNVKEIREYEWGSGAPGSLVRRTTKKYLHTNNSNYLSRNIVSKIISETIFDGSNPTAEDCLVALGCKARTEVEYDSTTITATSGAPQHDYTGYPSTFIYRGNATKVKSWRNTDGVLLTSSYIYDDLGNIRSITDPGSHTTTWDYTDNWSGSGCLPPSNSLAYVKQVTNHLGHRIQLSRFPCTGLVKSRKDENDLLAARPGTTFTYDLFGRMLTKVETDGLGQTTNAYNDMPPVSATTTTKITSTLNLVSTATQDGLGRVKQTQLTSDPEGAVFVDTSYDALGRKDCETNPYRGAGPPPNTSTCYEYDALSRLTKVIPPDGTPTSNNVSTVYAGTTVTVTDQAGKVRKSESDALGRLIRVWEPNSSGSLVNKTRYFYDTLDNLTCVVQLATDGEPAPCAASPNPLPNATWRPRRFTYNSLSQLLKAENPESGTMDYTYDSDGNVLTKIAPKPNQTGALTVTATYAYDELHRLKQKAYNDGTTATVKYGYDNIALTGCTTTPPTISPMLNPKGRRTAMCDASGATSWSFDPEGATLTEKRTIVGSSSITKAVSYTYNLDGSLATLVYPSGRTITYTPSGAGRTLSAVDTANAINYATSALYAPHGALSSLKNGFVSGGFAGITTTNSYNNRLQPIVLSAAHAGGTVVSFSYAFDQDPSPSVVKNNGDVVQIINNRDNNRSQSFAYDELNRVAYAWSSGNLWGNQFVYDIWANLNKKLACPAGSPCQGKPQGENLDQSSGTKNQIAGFCYDAAGNLNGQSLCPILTYIYDAENRMVTTAGVTYTYDGDGKRVKKSSGKLYWTGTGSDALAETDLAGTVSDEYVFLGAKRIARRKSNGEVHYYFSDLLGSSRVVTNAIGQILDDIDLYPFGGERIIASSTGNSYKFTGKERDPESGLDFFGARHYASALGRFQSVDPFNPITDLGGEDETEIALRFQEYLSQPQNWNRYAYTRNNPLVSVDPGGKVGVLAIAWAVYEVASAVADVHAAVSTFRDPHASTEEKLMMAGLAGLSVAGPGGGYAAGVRLTKAIPNGVFGLPNAIRGRLIEALSGANLPRNFPAIDRFVNGVATSIKSMDIFAPSYQSAGRLFSKLTGYVDKLADFKGASYGGVSIAGADIKNRVLSLVISKGQLSQEQAKVLQQVVEYGKKVGVEVEIAQAH